MLSTPDQIVAWEKRWLGPIRQSLAIEMASADPGHGLEHVERVVKNAKRIAETLTVDYQVLLSATWFHDCVCVAKNSPLRSQASRLAAKRALGILEELGYPTDKFNQISHAIEAHSFSAGIQCESIEAQVLQDADRLEALGAIGLARCLMTGGAMGQRLYHPDDPFPTTRQLRDDQQSIDHFFAKLLKLPSTMQTRAGREIANQRKGFLVDFLKQLSLEIDVRADHLDAFDHLQ
ncbi:MAG: HD domain-containing protein [Pirellula sp.]